MDGDQLRLSSAERRTLRKLSAGSASRRLGTRAQIVLDAAAGHTDVQIARDRAVSPSTVKLWRCRFVERGIDGLSDRPRPGRPSALAGNGRPPRGGSADHSQPPGALAPEVQPRGHAGGDHDDDVDQTLEALLQAASVTISQRGFAATRVADIAAEAGVSPAAVHYYFRTKDEILVRALLWANEQPLRRIEESTSTGMSVRRLATFLAGSIPSTPRSRDEYLIEIDLWSHARHEPALLAAWEAYNERWTSCLRAILEQGAADRSFQLAAPAAEVAERIVSMTDGLAAQYVIGARRMPHRRLRDLVVHFAAQQTGITTKDLTAHESQLRD